MERRVRDIHTSYTRHAKEADVKYHGVERGPITQRLATMCLKGMAFGMMGEASSTCHQTIQVTQNRAWGRGRRRRRPTSPPRSPTSDAE